MTAGRPSCTRRPLPAPLLTCLRLSQLTPAEMRRAPKEWDSSSKLLGRLSERNEEAVYQLQVEAIQNEDHGLVALVELGQDLPQEAQVGGEGGRLEEAQAPGLAELPGKFKNGKFQANDIFEVSSKFLSADMVPTMLFPGARAS